jgi:hypothetical protein
VLEWRGVYGFQWLTVDEDNDAEHDESKKDLELV